MSVKDETDGVYKANTSTHTSLQRLYISNLIAKRKLVLAEKDIWNEEITCILNSNSQQKKPREFQTTSVQFK